MALSQSRGKPSETVATASLNARAEVNGMSPAVAKALDDAGYDVGRFIGKGMAQLVGCRSTGLHLTRVLGLCACGVCSTHAGSFSRVFMGIRRRDGKAVALKVIFADSRERRVANEVDQLVLAGYVAQSRWMQLPVPVRGAAVLTTSFLPCRGSHNIVKLLQYHRCGLTSILVLPYVRHDNFRVGRRTITTWCHRLRRAHVPALIVAGPTAAHEHGRHRRVHEGTADRVGAAGAAEHRPPRCEAAELPVRCGGKDRRAG